MTIFVKLLTGKILTLEVRQKYHIETVKNLISNQPGITYTPDE